MTKKNQMHKIRPGPVEGGTFLSYRDLALTSSCKNIGTLLQPLLLKLPGQHVEYTVLVPLQAALIVKKSPILPNKKVIKFVFLA